MFTVLNYCDDRIKKALELASVSWTDAPDRRDWWEDESDQPMTGSHEGSVIYEARPEWPMPMSTISALSAMLKARYPSSALALKTPSPLANLRKKP